MPAPIPVHLFHIAYSAQTRDDMEPGFVLLDNLANPRPDWFEFWPIRQWLMTETMREDTFYGFFSPKFRNKTGLSHADVVQQVQAQGASADVLLFSPFPTQIAYYLNIFEQGEVSHPGFMQLCMDALQAIGQPVAVNGLVMDSGQMVYSNYFVARPAFWREWLRWTQAIFDLCESSADPALQARLCAPTAYAGSVQFKVFLIERIASLLLAVQPRWRSVARNPFGHRHGSEPELGSQALLLACDALKLAYRQQPFPDYLRAFHSLRQWIVRQAASGTGDANLPQ